MPDILCKQCDAYISDPCVKLNTLFSIKMDLSNQLKRSPENDDLKTSIDHVNNLLEKHLGLQDYDQNFRKFVENKQTNNSLTTTHLFWLKCVNGHLNQYSVKCNS